MRLVDLIIFLILLLVPAGSWRSVVQEPAYCVGFMKRLYVRLIVLVECQGQLPRPPQFFLICKHSTVISFFIKQTGGSAMAELDLYSAER